MALLTSSSFKALTFPPLWSILAESFTLRVASIFFYHLSFCFQKMLFCLLPVVAVLLGRETAVSGISNDKWLGTGAQYNKDRSWNRFRDVSCVGTTQELTSPSQKRKKTDESRLPSSLCVNARACVCLSVEMYAYERARSALHALSEQLSICQQA